MVFWNPYPWYFDPVHMVYEPPTHSILTRLPMLYPPPSYGIMNPVSMVYLALSYGIMSTLPNGILTRLPMVYRTPSSCIMNPLSMVYRTSSYGIMNTIPMVFWPRTHGTGYIELPTHGILTCIPVVYRTPSYLYYEPPTHCILHLLLWSCEPPTYGISNSRSMVYWTL